MSAYFGTEDVRIYTKNYSVLNSCSPEVEPEVMLTLSDDDITFKDHDKKYVVNKEFIEEHNEMREQLKSVNLFMESLKEFFYTEKLFKECKI